MGKRAKPEEIIAKLGEAEIRFARGETAVVAARAVGVPANNRSTAQLGTNRDASP
jgi:hypothetical protein